MPKLSVPLLVRMPEPTLLPGPAQSTVKNGAVQITAKQCRPGQTMDLSGQWLYRPGYPIQAGEKPAGAAANDCVRVPVPQLRTHI